MADLFNLKKPAYELFVTQEEVELIHKMSLKVLEETGFSVEHEEAREIFRKAGAEIDGEIVKIKPELVEKCIKMTPSSFEIYSRGGMVGFGPQYPSVIGSLFGPPTVLDHHTNEYRPGTLQDTVDFLKLTETSDVVSASNLSIHDAVGIDRNLDNTYMPQQALMLKYTTKPLHIGTMGLLALKDKSVRIRDAIVENTRMLQKFYGVSEDTLVCTYIVNGISPLRINYDTVENMFGAIESKQGIQIAVLSIPNMTCPVSCMGSLVHDNAIILAEICLAQLMREGTPIIRCSLTSSVDMRYVSMCVASPESVLIGMASLALGRYYDIPTRCCGGQTDSYEPDYQAGVEAFMNQTALMWGNADFELHTCGILGSFNIASMEKFLFDEESIRYHKRIISGMAISEKKSFAKEMNKIGPGGNFLSGRTPKDYREDHRMYDVFNKEQTTVSLREKKGTLRDNAARIIDERLVNYVLPDASDAQKEFLNKYLPEGFKYGQDM